MAEPTLGSMLAAMGSPVDYQAINTAKLYWDDATGLFYASGGLKTNRMGLFGTYDSTKVQGIWSISEGYPISTQDNDFGTQYGLGYGYETYGGGLTGWGHQIHFLTNGTITATVSLTTGNFWSAGSITSSGNITAGGNIFWGTGGNWLSAYLNQAVLTTSGVTFANVYSTGYVRGYASMGLYYQSTPPLESGWSHWTYYGAVGDIYFSFTGGATLYSPSWVAHSDKRLKKDIAGMDSLLDKILQLKPSKFKFLEKRAIPEYWREEIGLVADDVQPLLPELVGVALGEDKTLTFDYPRLSVIAIKGIQEQHQIIDDLQKRIEKLEGK